MRCRSLSSPRILPKASLQPESVVGSVVTLDDTKVGCERSVTDDTGNSARRCAVWSAGSWPVVPAMRTGIGMKRIGVPPPTRGVKLCAAAPATVTVTFRPLFTSSAGTVTL